MMLSMFADVVGPSFESTLELNALWGFMIMMAVCLVGTIIIETLLSLALGVRGKNLWIVVLAQIVTNPLVVLTSNFVYYQSSSFNDFKITLLFSELVTFLLEGILYKEFLIKNINKKEINPFLLSLILNLVSFMVGMIWNVLQLLH